MNADSIHLDIMQLQMLVSDVDADEQRRARCSMKDETSDHGRQQELWVQQDVGHKPLQALPPLLQPLGRHQHAQETEVALRGKRWDGDVWMVLDQVSAERFKLAVSFVDQDRRVRGTIQYYA